MVKLQNNEYMELDKAYIDQLREIGVSDKMIQIGYNDLQRRRREEREEWKNQANLNSV